MLILVSVYTAVRLRAHGAKAGLAAAGAAVSPLFHLSFILSQSGSVFSVSMPGPTLIFKKVQALSVSPDTTRYRRNQDYFVCELELILLKLALFVCEGFRNPSSEAVLYVGESHFEG